MSFEFLDHTADISFRATGRTLPEAFESAVLAFAKYVSNGHKIVENKERVVRISGMDIENLLYTFLDELIYLFDAEGFLAVRAVLRINGNDLEGTLFGDDSENYKGLRHVKSATYADMLIRNNGPEGWELKAVLDV